MPEQIEIKKEELLEILRKNLELHEKIYKCSLEGFKKKFVFRCKKVLFNTKRDIFNYSILSKLIEPEEHIDDYKSIIRMMELEVKNTIFLTVREFQQYVLNKWNWIDSFKLSYYSNSSPSSSSSSSNSSSIEYENYFK